MMIWFDRIFPVLMTITPALIVYCTRPHATAATEQAPALARRIYLFTVLALVAHVVAMSLFETLQEGRSAGRTSWVSGFSLFAFFWLWFGCAAPALAARHPGWGNPHGTATPSRPAPARTASLTARHVDSGSMLPTTAWVLGWTLYAACLGGTVWSVMEGVHVSLLLGLALWPGFVWGVRAARIEAEPRDAAGSAELEVAYAGLRRFRAWCFYWCGALGTFLMSMTAVAVALELPMADHLGGIGGGAIGLMGGVLGTMASLRRARINGLLHDLNQQGNSETA
jgi:hypothetical protein